MITSGCKRMACILHAVIECNLMVGRSKLKGSFIPELWSPIDKVQLADFDHPCYQFTWWRAFLQHNLDRDVFPKGKGGLGAMSGPGQSFMVSQCYLCGWLLVRHCFRQVPSGSGQRWGNVLDRITNWAALLTWESTMFNYIFPVSHYPSWYVAT